MSTVPTTTMIIPGAAPASAMHRFTVDEYERIIPSGALKDPDKIELVNGYMVDKMAKSPAAWLFDEENP